MNAPRLEKLLTEPRYEGVDGSPASGPDNCWNRVGGLIDLIRHAAPQTVCEVGCHRGVSTEAWLLLGCTVTAVDRWADLTVWDTFDARLRGYPELRTWRGESTEAAEMFPAGAFDLVYLDADHTYDGICNDLDAWLPRVRDGGWMSGHDFTPSFP